MGKSDRVIDSLLFGAGGWKSLSRIDTSSTPGMDDKGKAAARLSRSLKEISEFQYRLYAEAKRGLLVVFQAMDTGGKDGVIRKVFGPLNPQGVEVSSFKRPTPIELAHDYLWRIHARLPARGMIGVFNRSHYEDVLVPRAHGLLSAKELEKRCRQINDFERHLTENGLAVIKIFLHISKDEQKRRLEERLADPDKRWKFESGDLEERKLWDKYQEAYQAALEKCSTPCAPWRVVPADRKWYRDWAAAEIVRRELERLDPRFPKAGKGLGKVRVR
ncbi:MAG: polyphosphate kinase 2 family protein [Planctomycetota bacterium]|jgi:PPK2 family polyphosphate:nucleotide phosphotransferase|nr:polyphosphate kinase 2 family protein [Planctomycetota bacterium]